MEEMKNPCKEIRVMHYIDFIPLDTTNEKLLTYPSYATKLSSGMDLCAYIVNKDNEPYSIDIGPGQCYIIDTGFKCKMLCTMEGQIRSKSGLAAKYGLVVLNSPGTIDADYDGPIKVILYNTSNEIYKIKHGNKIAQFVISPVVRELFYLSNDCKERGTGGFGSTGQ